MALITDTITNFIGGVSQQPDKLMYPNQSKEMINFYLNPARGAVKRPPSEFIAKLMPSLSLYPKVHTIIKEDEEYLVILTGDDIKVFDLQGNEKTLYYGDLVYEVIHGETLCYTDVAGASGDTVANDTVLYSDYKLTTEYTLADGESKSDFTYNGTNQPAEQIAELKQYITTQQPTKDLKAITTGDYTFVLNTTVCTEMEDELFPDDYPNAAIIFIKQGDYSCNYTIKVNGSTAASYTSTQEVSTCRTDTIASNLYNNLVSNLGQTDWNITREGSTILLQKKDKSTFTITNTDGNANSNSYALLKKAEDLTQLPLVAPDGYVMKVIGENINISDDYYVKFETNDGTNFGYGSWQECPSPECKYRLKKETMPHAITRNADGTFTFKTVDWADRKAGDEDSAKTPSFVDNPIKDIFVHKGRLALLAVDKSIYSDVNDIFQFFRTTVITNLDTDAIDVGSNSRMSLLNHAVPFNKELILFGQNSEFLIQGSSSVFSNSTVSIEMLIEYTCSLYCKPISVGSNVIFTCNNGDYSKIYELYVADTYNIAAREISEQVPQYIPKDIFKITASSENNIACFLSSADANTLYMYNYYYNNSNKQQSAWSKWQFKNTKILDVEFVNDYLYLTMQYSDGIYYEKINISRLKGDDNLDFIIRLDRKQKQTVTNHQVTLGYTPTNDLLVINPSGFPVDYTINNSNVITINGDYDYVYTGTTYESKWILSSIYKRVTTQSGMKVQEGILMLKDINLSYADTSYFKVTLKPTYTTAITSVLEFTGIVDGTVSATLNKITPYSSTFLIPVISNNEEIELIVSNDSYLPCTFLSLEWLGDFTTRGK